MRYALSCLTALALLAGCTPKIEFTGADRDYLADIPKSDSTTTSANLLPLQVGSVWEMSGTAQGRAVSDEIRVLGPATVGPETGTLLGIYRYKKLWRREVYTNDTRGLRLLAFGEDKEALLALSPPLTVCSASVHEGDALPWNGEIIFKKQRFKAHGFSRCSGQDSLRIRLGSYVANRIETVITMERPNDSPLHFPSIRWLAPGLGFIQRSYADDGRPATTHLERYLQASTGAPKSIAPH